MRHLVALSAVVLLFGGLAVCAPIVSIAHDSLLSGPLEPTGLECESCKILMGVLQGLMLQNASEDEIVNVVTKVCIELKIEDENVCNLVVLEFKV